MSTMTAEDLGARVRRLRLAAGLTQAGLAGAAGMTLGNLAQIEQGVNTNPRLATLRSLAKALGVTLDELAGPPEG
jgi:transcriptional regulator with XRE-family HTH domain